MMKQRYIRSTSQQAENTGGGGGSSSSVNVAQSQIEPFQSFPIQRLINGRRLVVRTNDVSIYPVGSTVVIKDSSGGKNDGAYTVNSAQLVAPLEVELRLSGRKLDPSLSTPGSLFSSISETVEHGLNTPHIIYSIIGVETGTPYNANVDVSDPNEMVISPEVPLTEELYVTIIAKA